MSKGLVNGSVLQSFWTLPASDLLSQLESSKNGLTDESSSERLIAARGVRLADHHVSGVRILLAQFNSPITLLLIFAAILSAALHDATDAIIILIIVAVSGLLGFWQEFGAANAAGRLLRLVAVTSKVRRGGATRDLTADQIVPGDVIELSAGSSIPADCILLESRDLFVNEAALTGETFPVEKGVGVAAPDAPLAKRTNELFLGTHVVSGTATAVVVLIGRQTELGRIAEKLRTRAAETDFERGVRRFGNLLLEVTLLLLIAIFAINVYLGKPVMDSLLFALALAVGLTPQLLPAIISVNLARGSRRMAAQDVVVKRLASIQNLGSMTLLCSDKTGTLTEGLIRIDAALDVSGAPSEQTLRCAFLNSVFESGYANPIDDAIREYRKFDLAGVTKLDELPYDFIRKRLSVLIHDQGENWIITKGAASAIRSICTHAESDGKPVEIHALAEQIDHHVSEWCGRGMRVLAVARKQVAPGTVLSRADEQGMTLIGFLLLHDPLKADILETLAGLGELGVRLVCITGDNKLVAAALGTKIGWSTPTIVTGPELNAISDEALTRRAQDIDIFAEVEPNQKERIILALRKGGAVVGYMGDGINDAPALHAADVSISVNTAADVAKDAADIVLLRAGLNVLIDGVREGRRTFANTLKYVHMATSANFGNMFSMAGASLLLPFLPLLPKQVLLTNLMTDFPEMAIASDDVDDEMVRAPRRWDIGFVRRFMLVFGLLSSVFDYLTFGVLLLVLRASPEQFRTGWFVESIVSAALVVLTVRSRRPFFQSRPGMWLQLATFAVVIVTLVLPFTPIARPLGLTPLPLSIMAIMLLLVGAYLVSAEMCKRAFYARESIKR